MYQYVMHGDSDGVLRSHEFYSIGALLPKLQYRLILDCLIYTPCAV